MAIARKKGGYNYALRPVSVITDIVIPVDRSGNEPALVFLKCHRHANEAVPNYRYTIDFIGGTVGDEFEKSPRKVAVQELKEEVGCESPALKLLAKNVPVSPGTMAERNYFWLADNVKPLSNKPHRIEDPYEATVIEGKFKVPVSKVGPWLANEQQHGAVVANNVFAGLFLIAQEFPKLVERPPAPAAK